MMFNEAAVKIHLHYKAEKINKKNTYKVWSATSESDMKFPQLE